VGLGLSLNLNQLPSSPLKTNLKTPRSLASTSNSAAATSSIASSITAAAGVGATTVDENGLRSSLSTPRNSNSHHTSLKSPSALGASSRRKTTGFADLPHDDGYHFSSSNNSTSNTRASSSFGGHSGGEVDEIDLFATSVYFDELNDPNAADTEYEVDDMNSQGTAVAQNTLVQQCAQDRLQ
jgi:hypothetical protein